MANIKVLIVDDEESIVALLVRILSKDQIFEAATASRGYQAIALASQKKFDAIICDIDLPDIDGPGIIQEMKTKNICPPFVMFISGAVKSAPRNMSGNMVFVRKPFNPSEIISALIRFAPRS